MKHPSTWMALAVAASSAIVSSVDAAVVNWNLNLDIPATAAGLFINIEQQVYGDSPDMNAGWDLNPNGANALFFGGTTAHGTWMMVDPATGWDSASSFNPGVVVGSSYQFRALPGGNVIFGNAPGLWKENANNIFGFRFLNAQNQVRYGYGVMYIGATALERRLVSLSYETTGLSIVAVPAPGAIALVTLAGVFGCPRRRR
ncbi:MAG: hypothetical protein RL005_391 [Planctomycetota bacterium]|jgi:hypothetical protein